jgi:ribosomal protein S8
MKKYINLREELLTVLQKHGYNINQYKNKPISKSAVELAYRFMKNKPLKKS